VKENMVGERSEKSYIGENEGLKNKDKDGLEKENEKENENEKREKINDMRIVILERLMK
jgi:hypothetical protein